MQLARSRWKETEIKKDTASVKRCKGKWMWSLLIFLKKAFALCGSDLDSDANNPLRESTRFMRPLVI